MTVKLKILIIDDNPGDRLMLKQQLSAGELRDSTIIEADSMKTALAKSAEHSPHVALVDLQLPDSVGPVSINEFRKNFEEIPLIAMSGVYDDKAAKEILGYGAQEFFVKGSYSSEALTKGIIYAVERQRVQLQLYEQQNLFNKLTAVAQDAICILDESGKVIFWNNSAEKMFGYKTDEIFGKEFHPLLLPDSSIGDYHSRWDVFQKSGKDEVVDKTTEMVARRKNGEYFPIEISISAVVVSRKWHAIGIIRDITERKKSQEELEESLANRDKLFSIISHDLRNPFNALLGYSDIIRQNTDDFTKEELIKFAESMNTTAKQLVNLSNNLFNWAAVQTGRINISPKVFDLTQTLSNDIDLLKVSAKLKAIELEKELQAKAIIFGDTDLLNTVIRNLITNAIKFTPTGGKITVKMTSDKDATKIVVSDSGVGIPEDKLDRLFEFSSDKSTRGTANEKGSGLGLTLCKDFVKMMKGEITVESKIREGTTFRIVIPTTYSER